MSTDWVVVTTDAAKAGLPVVTTSGVSSTVIVPLPTDVEIVVAGMQGPPGPQGPIGPAGDAPTVICVTNVSGHRVLALNSEGKAVYANSSDETALSVQGINIQAGISGEELVVIKYGPVVWPAGGLTTGEPLFLRENGMISHEPPTTGWLRQIAVALSSSMISIDIGPTWYLGA